MSQPSGEQVELCFENQRAVVTEVGASLRIYEVDGEAVIDGYGEHELANAGRGQVLAPWPNRLEDGSYELSGRKGTAALDEPARGNAIHGLVRWLRWTVGSRTDEFVAFECDLAPQPAYPFGLGLEVSYTLSSDGLDVTVRARCEDEVPVPFGIGFHPYLLAGGEHVDEAQLLLPAASRLVLDERGLPHGNVDVAGTGYDFRSAGWIGDLHLDDCFTDLEGREAVLTTPASGRETFLRVDEKFGYLMVYTGDTLPDTAARRRAVAIEPMSCTPNAFRNGLGLVMLQPGEEWIGGWTLGVRPT